MIIGNAEILRELAVSDLPREELLDYINDIRTNGHHMLELVNDLLELSAVEAGSAELTEEELRIEQLGLEALASARRLSCGPPPKSRGGYCDGSSIPVGGSAAESNKCCFI